VKDARLDRRALTRTGNRDRHAAVGDERRLRGMKAILKAALMAALSGILVGALLKKKWRAASE